MFCVNTLLTALAVSLFSQAIAAQTCYYPDGQTISTDVACDSTANTTSCCPSDSFCMVNGLCFNSGVTSRGSCTDKNWTSEECTSYCRTTSTSTSVSLTPCDLETNTFVCGSDNTFCAYTDTTFTTSPDTSFVLHKSQIMDLLANTTILQSYQGRLYPAAAMVALGLGLGLPLLCALAMVLVELRKERRSMQPKPRYQPADEIGVQLPSLRPGRSFSLNRNETATTFHSKHKLRHSRSDSRRYNHNESSFATERDLGVPVYGNECSSPPYYEHGWVETPDEFF